VGDALHKFVDIAHRWRHSSGSKCRAAKCWQVLCILMVTLNNKLQETSKGAGAKHPMGRNCCAHLCRHSKQVQAQLRELVQGSHMLAGVVHTYGESK